MSGSDAHRDRIPHRTLYSRMVPMWYIRRMAHTSNYRVRLGDRGRVVLPAELRRQAGLDPGDELVMFYEDGSIRVAARRDLARAGRGLFRHLAGDRDLVGELLTERLREARADAPSGDAAG